MDDLRRAVGDGRSVVAIGSATIGDGECTIIAGPCSVESAEQIHAVAHDVAAAGAHILRGGTFKPRTSPYSFQGLGIPAVEMLAEAGRAAGLPTVTEVLDPRDVGDVATHVDALQIGARSMQNFPLLREIGGAGMPVILKRSWSATIEEWLSSAEYVLNAGCSSLVLCERGIRSFDPMTRNVLDVAAVPLLRGLTHLPVITDPSHGTGSAALVGPMAAASVAAGADGVMLEVHPEPSQALSDAHQALTPAAFAGLAGRLRALSSISVELGGEHRP